MSTPEPKFRFQFQHALAQINQAVNQCMECGVYRVDGEPPQIHHEWCESSGTAAYYRRMSAPPEHPPWVHMGYTEEGGQLWWAPVGTEPPTDSTYGPGYRLEGDDS